jgi:ATP-dependent exoDNAse (exonuclease V) alpha subunit
MNDILANTYTLQRIIRTEVLIIDEISMVSDKLLNVIDKLAMHARNNTKPFGGIKIIAVGDFFQLPPVKGDYCFTSAAWEHADFKICYLHEQHRQSDKVFNDILTNIRAGFLTDEQKDIIRSRVVDDVSGLGAIRLDTHNKKVDDINIMKLDRLEGESRTYVMDKRGNESAVAGLMANCLSPERLRLKVGAPVLFTKNHTDKTWVNGSQGEVVELQEDVVRVKMKNGNVVQVLRDSWERTEGYGARKVVIASVTQFPLKLAWAITIHKSQGMTLDDAVIDVSQVFACGHAYVAVSRVKALEGVHFQGRLTSGFLAVDEEVMAKDREFLRASALLEEAV